MFISVKKSEIEWSQWGGGGGSITAEGQWETVALRANNGLISPSQSSQSDSGSHQTAPAPDQPVMNIEFN